LKIKNLNFIAAQLPEVKHLCFVFDGVFTPNSVITDEDGREAVMCSRFDGLGLEKIRSINLNVSILSTETNPVVAFRAKKLGIDCDHGVKNKFAFAKNFCCSTGIALNNTAFVGNDENDLTLLRNVGVSFAPSDSWPSILNIVDFVTDRAGGYGCVREICEFFYEIKKVKNGST
jgi:YrbI family 3-deoxy-D-manno-octulosonate 8-phosphate phosphatase